MENSVKERVLSAKSLRELSSLIEEMEGGDNYISFIYEFGNLISKDLEVKNHIKNLIERCDALELDSFLTSIMNYPTIIFDLMKILYDLKDYFKNDLDKFFALLGLPYMHFHPLLIDVSPVIEKKVISNLKSIKLHDLASFMKFLRNISLEKAIKFSAILVDNIEDLKNKILKPKSHDDIMSFIRDLYEVNKEAYSEIVNVIIENIMSSEMQCNIHCILGTIYALRTIDPQQVYSIILRLLTDQEALAKKISEDIYDASKLIFDMICMSKGLEIKLSNIVREKFKEKLSSLTLKELAQFLYDFNDIGSFNYPWKDAKALTSHKNFVKMMEEIAIEAFDSIFQSSYVPSIDELSSFMLILRGIIRKRHKIFSREFIAMLREIVRGISRFFDQVLHTARNLSVIESLLFHLYDVNKILLKELLAKNMNTLIIVTKNLIKTSKLSNVVGLLRMLSFVNDKFAEYFVNVFKDDIVKIIESGDIDLPALEDLIRITNGFDKELAISFFKISIKSLRRISKKLDSLDIYSIKRIIELLEIYGDRDVQNLFRELAGPEDLIRNAIEELDFGHVISILEKRSHLTSYAIETIMSMIDYIAEKLQNKSLNLIMSSLINLYDISPKLLKEVIKKMERGILNIFALQGLWALDTLFSFLGVREYKIILPEFFDILTKRKEVLSRYIRAGVACPILTLINLHQFFRDLDLYIAQLDPKFAQKLISSIKDDIRFILAYAYNFPGLKDYIAKKLIRSHLKELISMLE